MTKTNEVAPVSFSRADLVDIAKQAGNLDDLTNALGVPGVIDATDFSDSLPVIEDPESLVKTPFVIFDSRENIGDFGVFTSLSIAVLNSQGSIVDRGILNMGVAGTDQWNRLRSKLEDKGIVGPVLVKRGLRRSEYQYSQKMGRALQKGETADDAINATTFYLDM